MRPPRRGRHRTAVVTRIRVAREGTSPSGPTPAARRLFHGRGRTQRAGVYAAVSCRTRTRVERAAGLAAVGQVIRHDDAGVAAGLDRHVVDQTG